MLRIITIILHALYRLGVERFNRCVVCETLDLYKTFTARPRLQQDSTSYSEHGLTIADSTA